MDPIALIFYAVVCACLSAASPAVPKLPVRLAIGAAVGISAAAILPVLKAALTVSP